MSEYSSRPGTLRSYDARAEFEEPCTRNRIGSGVSPVLGAPTRLRQRLSATSPFLAQYSPAPDRPVAPSSRAVALGLSGQGGREPRPDAKACSLEDRAPRKVLLG